MSGFEGERRETANYTWYLTGTMVKACGILVRKKSRIVQNSCVTRIAHNLISVKILLDVSGLPDITDCYIQEHYSNKLPQFHLLYERVQAAVMRRPTKKITLGSSSDNETPVPGSVYSTLSQMEFDTPTRIQPFAISFICAYAPSMNTNVAINFYTKLYDFLVEELLRYSEHHLLLVGNFEAELTSEEQSEIEKILQLTGSCLAPKIGNIHNFLFRGFINSLQLRVGTTFKSPQSSSEQAYNTHDHMMTTNPSPCVLLPPASFKPGLNDPVNRLITVSTLVPLFGVCSPKVSSKPLLGVSSSKGILEDKDAYGLIRAHFVNFTKKVTSHVSNRTNLSRNKKQMVDSIIKSIIDGHSSRCNRIAEEYSLGPYKRDVLYFIPSGFEDLYTIENGVLRTPKIIPKEFLQINILLRDVITKREAYSITTLNSKVMKARSLIRDCLKQSSDKSSFTTYMQYYSATEREILGVHSTKDLEEECKTFAEDFDEEWAYALDLLKDMQHPSCSEEDLAKGKAVIRSLIRFHLDNEPEKVAIKVAKLKLAEAAILSINKWSNVESLKSLLGDVSTDFDDIICNREKFIAITPESPEVLTTKKDRLLELLQNDTNFETCNLGPLTAVFQKTASAIRNKLHSNTEEIAIFKQKRKEIIFLVTRLARKDANFTWKQVKQKIESIARNLEEADILCVAPDREDKIHSLINDLKYFQKMNPNKWLLEGMNPMREETSSEPVSNTTVAQKDEVSSLKTVQFSSSNTDVIQTAVASMPADTLDVIKNALTAIKLREKKVHNDSFVENILKQVISLERQGTVDRTPAAQRFFSIEISKLITKMLSAVETGFDTPKVEARAKKLLNAMASHLENNMNQMRITNNADKEDVSPPPELQSDRVIDEGEQQKIPHQPQFDMEPLSEPMQFGNYTQRNRESRQGFGGPEERGRTDFCVPENVSFPGGPQFNPEPRIDQDFRPRSQVPIQDKPMYSPELPMRNQTEQFNKARSDFTGPEVMVPMGSLDKDYRRPERTMFPVRPGDPRTWQEPHNYNLDYDSRGSDSEPIQFINRPNFSPNPDCERQMAPRGSGKTEPPPDFMESSFGMPVQQNQQRERNFSRPGQQMRSGADLCVPGQMELQSNSRFNPEPRMSEHSQGPQRGTGGSGFGSEPMRMQSTNENFGGPPMQPGRPGFCGPEQMDFQNNPQFHPEQQMQNMNEHIEGPPVHPEGPDFYGPGRMPMHNMNDHYSGPLRGPQRPGFCGPEQMNFQNNPQFHPEQQMQNMNDNYSGPLRGPQRPGFCGPERMPMRDMNVNCGGPPMGSQELGFCGPRQMPLHNINDNCGGPPMRPRGPGFYSPEQMRFQNNPEFHPEQRIQNVNDGFEGPPMRSEGRGFFGPENMRFQNNPHREQRMSDSFGGPPKRPESPDFCGREQLRFQNNPQFHSEQQMESLKDNFGGPPMRPERPDICEPAQMRFWDNSHPEQRIQNMRDNFRRPRRQKSPNDFPVNFEGEPQFGPEVPSQDWRSSERQMSPDRADISDPGHCSIQDRPNFSSKPLIPNLGGGFERPKRPMSSQNKDIPPQRQIRDDSKFSAKVQIISVDQDVPSSEISSDIPNTSSGEKIPIGATPRFMSESSIPGLGENFGRPRRPFFPERPDISGPVRSDRDFSPNSLNQGSGRPFFLPACEPLRDEKFGNEMSSETSDPEAAYFRDGFEIQPEILMERRQPEAKEPNVVFFKKLGQICSPNSHRFSPERPKQQQGQKDGREQQLPERHRPSASQSSSKSPLPPQQSNFEDKKDNLSVKSRQTRRTSSLDRDEGSTFDVEPPIAEVFGGPSSHRLSPDPSNASKPLLRVRPQVTADRSMPQQLDNDLRRRISADSSNRGEQCPISDRPVVSEALTPRREENLDGPQRQENPNFLDTRQSYSHNQFEPENGRFDRMESIEPTFAPNPGRFNRIESQEPTFTLNPTDASQIHSLLPSSRFVMSSQPRPGLESSRFRPLNQTHSNQTFRPFKRNDFHRRKKY